MPSKGVLKKRYSENMEQIYRRTPMRKCDDSLLDESFYESDVISTLINPFHVTSLSLYPLKTLENL